ncbi:MAG: DUF2849 domain-containing protein [Brevundimonas sp.]|uniref:DUF2849 domain-containing protein n=1 Tax=Brevundimonas sp. TaxID=1871086 RepID=UPI0027371CE5|nr:DUF2849 domain-containing protein [Brevundimonas sp.]MDP3404137.1 DUF2849 domain-containing protein [Brevundimonas sp.]
MKIVTANRLSDGRVIYANASGYPVETFDEAGLFADEAADLALSRAAGDPATFVNPYLVEVEAGRPSGRDRFKEQIRARGPTVGHSLDHA